MPCVNLEDNCIVSAGSIISKTTHPINLFFIKI
nr:hypothetical protein [Campylobacter jejuni]